MVTGQWLFSDTRTPNRPDLAAEWTGQSLTATRRTRSGATTRRISTGSAQYKDIGDGFRADTGFVPQVGYREVVGQTGWTFRPTGFVSRVRTFVNVDRQVDRPAR